MHKGTISLWQLQANELANELADEQAKTGLALRVAQLEQSYRARASFLGWLAKFLDLREIQRLERRGTRVQRQRHTLLEKLVMFQCDVVKAATKAGWDWCDVVRELERDVLGVAQTPEWHDPHESQ